MNLGKLKEVDLREAWPHEASHFTKWLSEETNLNLLGDEVALEIKLIKTEADVGDFSADILAEEENTGRKIIIENQLEITNHDHLGKLITYASGYNAGVVIWVVKDVREEHRKAVDWLNEHTDEDIEFYLVKIKVWQIENSPLAPKFEIISKPNDWAKTVKESVGQNQLTDTKLKQWEFWNQFKEYAKKSNTKLRLQRTYPQHWTNISIGSSDAHLALTLNSKENLFGVELYIPKNKELYSQLFQHKNDIEKDLNEGSLEWMELPEKKASRVRVSYPGDFNEEGKWEVYFGWLLTVAEKFHKVFPEYLKDF